MSTTAELAQIWSIDLGPTSVSAAPPVVNFDIWAVNSLLIHRLGANRLASLANTAPASGARLRDEGVVPLYLLMRDMLEALKPILHERGVALPAISDTPADWREEALNDFKALAAQFSPYMADATRELTDWDIETLDRDPEPQWASVVTAFSLGLEMLFQMAPAMSGMMEDNGLGPLMALMGTDENRGITKVFNRELMRIRAQGGSGWDEAEARSMSESGLEVYRRVLLIGT